MLKHLIQRIRGNSDKHAHKNTKSTVTDTNATYNDNVQINNDVRIETLSEMQPPTLTDQIASDLGGSPIHVPVFSPSGAPSRASRSAQQKPAKADDMSGLPFMIRPADASEINRLNDVFVRAIEGSAKLDYDPPQIAAWASQASTAEFNNALTDGVTILAEHHDQPIAFAQLSPNDCIRMLYVDPEWTKLGIATLMCQYLEDEARILGSTRLTTNASRTAKRFFESMGFKTEQEETVEINGVTLSRTKMEKRLRV